MVEQPALESSYEHMGCTVHISRRSMQSQCTETRLSLLLVNHMRQSRFTRDQVPHRDALTMQRQSVTAKDRLVGTQSHPSSCRSSRLGPSGTLHVEAPHSEQ